MNSSAVTPGLLNSTRTPRGGAGSTGAGDGRCARGERNTVLPILFIDYGIKQGRWSDQRR
ncbi:hypothetical protein [Streptomyces sp. NPDC048473]|uniref:hypothetical protein n=1 Tax=unclassified Streptomyces TaxID=2593676 RepID=UPI00371F61A9